ncbi:MAG TPA: SDR family oxidoreductase [Solirubrobacteraceae bacterium]|jgi:3-oxoacyl-[acyl-carrier protein] reductase
MFTPLSGRVVLVTGGTRGIGLGIARVFAGAGARVVITGRDATTGAAAADALAAITPDVLFVRADAGEPADAERMVAETVERFGGLNVLCANAGLFPQARVEEMTAEAIASIFAVNVTGTMLAARAAVPALAGGGQGRIVVTASITGPHTGVPGWSHYGATKAAQLGFVRAAAVELAPQGITVNAVLPGNIDTGDEQTPLDARRIAASIPSKRLGTVEDIGHAALFLASAEAGYITGQTIVVDGGQILTEWADLS